MKYLLYLFFLGTLSQSIYANSYLQSLDMLIDEKVEIIEPVAPEIKNLVAEIQTSTKKELSLREVDLFLDREESLVFLFCHNFQRNFDIVPYQQTLEVMQALRDVKDALGVKLYVHYLVCCQQKMLHQARNIDEMLNFWQDEKFAQSQSFYQQYIVQRTSRLEYQEEIERNIVALQEIAQRIHSLLGLVVYNQSHLQQAENQETFKKNLNFAARLQDEFIYTIFPLSGQRINDEVFSLFHVLQQSIKQVSAFTMQISAQCVQYQIPSDFVRNWEGYALTSIGVCACACIYLHYGSQIAQGSHFFWTEHVQGPLERNMKALCGFIQPPQLSTLENEKNATLLIDEELKKPAPRTSQDCTVFDAVRQDLDIVSDGAVGEMYNEAKDFAPMNPFTWQLGRLFTPVGNQVSTLRDKGLESMNATTRQQEPQVDFQLLSPEAREAIAIERIRVTLANQSRNPLRLGDAVALKLELEAKASKTAINEILKDMHVVLGMTALLPMIGVVGGSLFASKTLYNSVAYQPIRNFVHRLEIFLNGSLYQEMSFDREGYIYFLTEQLKKAARVLTLAEQKMIHADINELQSYNLDYGQKFNVIQRMYRMYPCLVQGHM